MYQYVSAASAAASAIHATRGVVAGCGFATTWVKVCSLLPMREALAYVGQYMPPLVGWTTEIYIDDLQMHVEADTQQGTVDPFVDMAEIFRDMVHVGLKADLA